MGTIVPVVLRKNYRGVAVVAAAGLLLAGCGGSSDKSSDLAAPFDYDSSKPLSPQSRSLPGAEKQGVDVRQVSFAGPSDNRMTGFLVVPKGSGKHPAVIYAHGAGGTRAELLGQGAALSKRGVVALMLDMAYSPARAAEPPPGIDGLRARTANEVESVREVRRSVDYLSSLPEVDKEQIGYVGWSAGARMGAIVAGVDHRIKAFDLLAGGSSPIAAYVNAANQQGVPEDLKKEIEDLLTKTDPLRYVGHAAPSALLFQDGRHDELVPQPALKTMARTASEPKELRWYDSGHVPGNKAWAESRAWLSERLGLT
jgi:dipeptidyl aminopeptidase/acylaminoacyl peptidase